MQSELASFKNTKLYKKETFNSLKTGIQNASPFYISVFLCGDEESGHYACIDVHLTTAYNPGMRLMPLPVIYWLSKSKCAPSFFNVLDKNGQKVLTFYTTHRLL